MTQSDIRKMLNDLDASNADRETLKQKCHELENQVNLLQDEKTNITAEFEQLQSQVRYSDITSRMIITKLIPQANLYIYFKCKLSVCILGHGKRRRHVENGGIRKWKCWRNKTAQKAT